MFNTYFPTAIHTEYGLKEYFANRDIEFGMAGEYYAFDSSVQAPLVKRHAAILSTEVSMKWEYTQPLRGVYSYDYADAMIARCQEFGIDAHGHCVMWHMQYPAWMEEAMANADMDGRYAILAEHVERVMRHYAPTCKSIDVVNEHQPAVAANAGVFVRYIGADAGRFAMQEARKYAGDCKLYYNSFFRTDADADYAISLLDVADGIGVQIHIGTWTDRVTFFDRIRRMLQACKDAGRTVRFSEVSVQKGDDATMLDVAMVWADIVRLAIAWGGTVVNVTQWGVKGQSWNGGYLLFDYKGLPNECYSLVVKELTGR